MEWFWWLLAGAAWGASIPVVFKRYGYLLQPPLDDSEEE